MKIPASIRKLYDHQNEICIRLKEQVDALVRPQLHERWHYESRVKSAESFTLKIESGRFKKPSALEDFFAATIVVRNGSEIIEAEKLVAELFSSQYRRPKNDNETTKAPEAFPFDDLRLYLQWKDSPALPPTGLDGVLFEVQIKTFLQHAWAIATHNLIYKSDEANWSKARIAYQIKAMLEHAEISIQEAESLATSAALAKQDQETTEVKRGIALLKSQWASEELPDDVRRLARNITALIRGLRLEMNRLETILNEGKASAGAHPSNLSPFATVVQYLLKAEKEKMVALLNRDKSSTTVLIPGEIDFPQDVNRSLVKNAIFISAG